MKILLANSFYSPNMVGGAEHSAKLLVEGLLEAGNRVAVVTFDGSCSGGIQWSEVNGALVARCGDGWFSSEIFAGDASKTTKALAFGHGLYNRAAYRSCQEIIQRFRPDVLHTNSLYGLSTLVWRAGRRHGVPVVHTARDFALVDPRGILGTTPSAIAYPYARWVRKRFASEVKVLTAPSQYLLGELHERGIRGGDHDVAIPNCIELDRGLVDVQIERKMTEFNPAEFPYLYVGRLERYKGVDVLLNAFARLADPSARLWFCGEGSLAPTVEAAARRDARIHYFGQVAPERVRELMMSSGAQVVPSVWGEPFGRVVIEALGCGTPVVGSDVGGIAETITTSGGGLLFRAGDSRSLLRQMRRIRAQDVWSGAVRRGLASISEYSRERCAQRYVDLYRSVAGRHLA